MLKCSVRFFSGGGGGGVGGGQASWRLDLSL